VSSYNFYYTLRRLIQNIFNLMNMHTIYVPKKFHDYILKIKSYKIIKYYFTLLLKHTVLFLISNYLRVYSTSTTMGTIPSHPIPSHLQPLKLSNLIYLPKLPHPFFDIFPLYSWSSEKTCSYRVLFQHCL